MNPKEKSLREIIDILDAFAIKRTEKDKDIRHLITGKQFEDLASAIQSHYKVRQLSKREIEKIIQPYWFLALFIPFLGITWLIEKITSTIFKAQEEKDK